MPYRRREQLLKASIFGNCLVTTNLGISFLFYFHNIQILILLDDIYRILQKVLQIMMIMIEEIDILINKSVNQIFVVNLCYFSVASDN